MTVISGTISAAFFFDALLRRSGPTELGALFLRKPGDFTKTLAFLKEEGFLLPKRRFYPLDGLKPFPYNAPMNIILTIQAILSVLLILCILLQQRAAGLTAGGGSMNTMVVQRRGAEKLLHQATFVFAGLFFVLTIVEWFV